MSNHLFVSKLSLINFKNYKQADLSLSPDINCFIGENGAGKTNVLDAIHYLSMCKSYLNPIDSQNILFDESFLDRKSTRLNSSHVRISYAVFCLKKKRFIYIL